MHFYNNGSWVRNDPTDSVVIAVGQSFQVRKSFAGGMADFTFTNAMRLPGNPAFYKPTAAREQYMNITVEDASNRSDKAMVYFMDDAQDGFDAQYDANRLLDGGDKPMVYTKAGKERMGYNALPKLNIGEQKSVPLSVRVQEGNTKLSFADVQTLHAVVVLEDRKLNTKQRVTEGYEYAFTVAKDDHRDRFIMHFTGSFPTDVPAIENANDRVALFPNPTTGTVTLLFGQEHDYTSARVLDMSGREVKFQSLTPVELQTLDLGNLPEGVYFIRLSGSATTTLKLIKQ